eukprot:TRINITY_DN31095_c0_g1_i3.p3 TRINITY_DN31095_c0_g1~~TRINITY_DN31095_c0_g1_i3.p3  ORF type:complete len:131 (+),score=42.67 TRINITY_DN31095_c0_g1_i3:176-568(+)
MQRGLVGSEMCIRDSINAEYMGKQRNMETKKQTQSEIGVKDGPSDVTTDCSGYTGVSEPEIFRRSLHDIEKLNKDELVSWIQEFALEYNNFSVTVKEQLKKAEMQKSENSVLQNDFDAFRTEKRLSLIHI